MGRAVILFLIALSAALLGFGDAAIGSMETARIVFFTSFTALVVALIFALNTPHEET